MRSAQDKVSYWLQISYLASNYIGQLCLLRKGKWIIYQLELWLTKRPIALLKVTCGPCWHACRRAALSRRTLHNSRTWFADRASDWCRFRSKGPRRLLFWL